ncbi:hypothetical protein CEXT_199871 [Caerostris extrusa]|uniref:Uncharacterized protein n=1 Tax=Caerostris extrusa TaxID=172846 RepID=A0AAV4QYB6_CAEEX|nr:hypothetical protein CEXT_199871 [Caerostris extrusa]
MKDRRYKRRWRVLTGHLVERRIVLFTGFNIHCPLKPEKVPRQFVSFMYMVFFICILILIGFYSLPLYSNSSTMKPLNGNLMPTPENAPENYQAFLEDIFTNDVFEDTPTALLPPFISNVPAANTLDGLVDHIESTVGEHQETQESPLNDAINKNVKSIGIQTTHSTEAKSIREFLTQRKGNKFTDNIDTQNENEIYTAYRENEPTINSATHTEIKKSDVISDTTNEIEKSAANTWITKDSRTYSKDEFTANVRTHSEDISITNLKTYNKDLPASNAKTHDISTVNLKTYNDDISSNARTYSEDISSVNLKTHKEDILTRSFEMHSNDRSTSNTATESTSTEETTKTKKIITGE